MIGRIEQAPEYDQLWIVDGDKGSYYMDENGQAIAPYAPMAEDDFAFEQEDWPSAEKRAFRRKRAPIKDGRGKITNGGECSRCLK